MRATFAGCCARAAMGEARTPPTNPMNSRRLIAIAYSLVEAARISGLAHNAEGNAASQQVRTAQDCGGSRAAARNGQIGPHYGNKRAPHTRAIAPDSQIRPHQPDGGA